MKLKKGFTLIELLVVIAIIAILAAIIFPVYARVKDSAYRSSDMSNMNAIRVALQLYKTDQGQYPPSLLGYATQYLPNTTNLVPANQLKSALYPKRVDSLETFRPAYLRLTNPNTAMSTAHWPTGDIVASAGQPKQRYGTTQEVEACLNGSRNSVPYYDVSGYDVATVKGATEPELRYTLFWSGWSVAANPCSPDPTTESGSAQDDPRQMGYTDPPETTVITWDSFFRDYDPNGVPLRSGKRDLVLFLGGAAKPMDSLDVSQKAWTVTP